MGNSSYRWSTVYGGYGDFSDSVTAKSFAKIGGTSSQFLKADGSVDANVYFYIVMYCHVDFHQSHAFCDTAKVQKTGKGEQNNTRSMKFHENP